MDGSRTFQESSDHWNIFDQQLQSSIIITLQSVIIIYLWTLQLWISLPESSRMALHRCWTLAAHALFSNCLMHTPDCYHLCWIRMPLFAAVYCLASLLMDWIALYFSYNPTNILRPQKCRIIKSFTLSWIYNPMLTMAVTMIFLRRYQESSERNFRFLLNLTLH